MCSKPAALRLLACLNGASCIGHWRLIVSFHCHAFPALPAPLMSNLRPHGHSGNTGHPVSPSIATHSSLQMRAHHSQQEYKLVIRYYWPRVFATSLAWAAGGFAVRALRAFYADRAYAHGRPVCADASGCRGGGACHDWKLGGCLPQGTAISSGDMSVAAEDAPGVLNRTA